MAKCPSCNASIRIDATECTSCNASFEGELAWRPAPETPAEEKQLTKCLEDRGILIQTFEHHAPKSGRLEIPRRLWKLLPWWQRNWNNNFLTPVALLSIVGFLLSYNLAGMVLLGLAIALHLARFWAARAFLIQRGAWQAGEYHTEVLPLIYKWRAIFFALLSLSIAGACLILEAQIQIAGLTTATVVALGLLAPAYFRSSLIQGSIGNWPMTNYRRDEAGLRSKETGLFWLGLYTYTGVIALLSAITIFLVLN